MIKKLLIIGAAMAITGFVGAANAGDTPDILGPTNLKPDQVLTSEAMSKVVGTNAAAAAASAAAAGSHSAGASESTNAFVNTGNFFSVFFPATAVGNSNAGAN